ncbi:MAG: ABC transporter permease [Acidimicrobiia bacterium]|nr:ABC transporter permease [Acidimicrobiia bacterium]
MGVLTRKVVQLLVVLLIVTFFSFLLLSLMPGDPVEVMVPYGSEEQRAEIRGDLGLDDPMPVRYVTWLGGFLRGDFGKYYTVSSDRPVSERLGDALPVSLQLMLYAQVLALVVAVPLGIFSAYRAGSRFDKVANTTAFGLLAIPSFAIALLMAYYVGVKLRLLPVGGYRELGDGAVEHFRRMLMPAVSLAVGQIAVYMRLLRSDMIATLQEDYISMAVSKGVSPRRVLWRHALRPSSLTLLTVAALNVGSLIGGAVVIEVIFQLPGMGMAIYEAILSRQYVAVQSFVAVIGVSYVVLNFLVDVLYGVVDPRIRDARALA